MTDQKILELFSSGKREKAFAQLYCEWPQVQKMVRNSGGTKEDAHDIFQDTLLILFERLQADRFVLNGSLGGFIYHTARNITYARLRKQQQLQQTEFSAKGLSEETGDAGTELFQLAEMALQKVTEKCRELFRLFYWEKYSMQEIARRLDLKTEQVAKTQKYKCLEVARNEFARLRKEDRL